MKAKEVLKRYKAGERNFQDVNLSGQSFKGKNLSGADFSGADFTNAKIQGTKFTKATLTKADFTGAECGRTIFSPIVWFWLIGSFYIIFNSLLVVAIINFTKLLDFGVTLVNYLSLVFWLLALFIVTFIGLKKLDKVLVKEEEVSGAIVMVFCSVGAGTLIILIILSMIDSFTPYALQSDVETLVFYGSLFGSLIIFSIATSAVIIKFVQEILPEKIIIFILLAIISMIIALVAKIIAIAIIPLILSGIILLTTIYLGWNAAKDTKRESWLRFFSIAVASWDGTSFYDANLTDAIFTKAKLKNADFRKANLTRVCWLKAEMLDQARIENTYLDNLPLLQLLTTGRSQDKNFERQDLRRINLHGADLTNTSFIDADLSQSNLQETILFESKLVRTNLDKTDLRNANLTGAYIEDWGITRNTKFEGIKGDFVYQRLPTKDNRDPNRMPPSNPNPKKNKFQKNDLYIYITSVLDTLDLYHRQNINAGVAITVLKGLTEDYPVQFELVAIEKRGDGQYVMKLKVFGQASHLQLQREYYDRYEQILPLFDPKKLIFDAEKIVTEIIETVKDSPVAQIQNQFGKGYFIVIAEGQVTLNYYEQSGNFGIGHLSGGEFKNSKIVGATNESDNYQLVIKNLEEKYNSQIQAKEQEKEFYRQQSEHLKKIVENLAKQPILIDLDKNTTNN